VGYGDSFLSVWFWICTVVGCKEFFGKWSQSVVCSQVMEGRKPKVVPEYLSQLANGRANSSSQNLVLTVSYNGISVSSIGEETNSVGVNESNSQCESLSVCEAIQKGVIMDACVVEEF
jgi:hypothetical protein